MTNNRERVYDEQVAPLLLQAAQIAEKNDFSLIALCEWDKGNTGTTRIISGNQSIAMSMADVAMRALGNLDTFMIGMMRYAREHGHCSMILQKLDVPFKPD